MIGCKYFAEQSGTKQLSCTEQIALEMYKTDSKFTIFLSHDRLLVSCGKERNRKKKNFYGTLVSFSREVTNFYKNAIYSVHNMQIQQPMLFLINNFLQSGRFVPHNRTDFGAGYVQL